MTSPWPDPASQRAALALSLLPGVGARAYQDLLAKFGTATHAFDAQAGESRDEVLALASEAIARAVERAAVLTAVGDATYPPRLLDLPDPPSCLFGIGDVSLLDRPVVAIVGTRGASTYGERIARQLASALVAAGATVMSGLARGIDAAAHRGALAAGGATVAVLGTGVDVAYPVAHCALHRDIGERGLLLSEALPGERAKEGCFPRRNRIIAALARVVIVVEAPHRSGALNTASHATALGRTVAAVPGPIDSSNSAGANALVRDGAQIVCDVLDALTLAGIAPTPARVPTLETAAERAVWQALADGALDLDHLTSRSALPARECLAALTSLELKGAVECALSGEISRRV